ncbi:MAG: DUF2975 domain-containing protein [Maricaulaceae bacterium]
MDVLQGVILVLLVLLALAIAVWIADLTLGEASPFGPVVTAEWADWPSVAFGFLASGVSLIVVSIVVLRLRRIFATLAQGDPFVPENAGHLQVIAVTLAAAEALRLAFGPLTVWIARTYGPPSAAPADPTFDFSIAFWFSILALFVLAEVFREGARMRAEQQVTI